MRKETLVQTTPKSLAERYRLRAAANEIANQANKLEELKQAKRAHSRKETLEMVSFFCIASFLGLLMAAIILFLIPVQ